MSANKSLRVLGAPGSPYTRKLLASLRYRRIPYEIIWGSHQNPPEGFPQPKVRLLPTVYFETDGGETDVAVDTTPLLRRLEASYARRSLIPDHPELSFYNDLLEDYGDEWLTKAMFHYRWYHEADRVNAGPLLVFWNNPSIDNTTASAISQSLTDRQFGRLYVVGSNDKTAAIIERSYGRFLTVLDTLLQNGGYILGTRPASCDFAAYGQLTQLGQVEPTSADLMSQTSRRVRAWLDRMEDLSGLDGDALAWPEPDALRARLKPMLEEIGRTYAPFMLANARAAMTGKPEVSAEIDGAIWEQPVFPYQAKCLYALGGTYSALNEQNRIAVAETLIDAGCGDLIHAFKQAKGT